MVFDLDWKRLSENCRREPFRFAVDGDLSNYAFVFIRLSPEPIFDTGDYGIVGDLFEAVPVLIEEIRKAKV